MSSRSPVLDRRLFLQGALLAGLQLTLQQRAVAASQELKGQILGLGFGAKRLSKQAATGGSVLTELNLVDGRWRATVLPIELAHTLLSVPGVYDLCLPQDGPSALWLSPQREVIGRLEAPEGWLFSGHGVVKEGLIYISVRRKEAHSFSDHGRIAVVEVKTRRMLGFFDSGGVRPHDMALRGQTLCVSHYGDINYDKAGVNAGNLRQARLVSLDCQTGRVLQTIDTPDFGSLTHFAWGREDSICAVPLRYYQLDAAGMRAVEQDLGGAEFEVSLVDELEARLAAPMPIVMIDRKKSKFQLLQGALPKQRRAQSVVYHAASDRYFITYSCSDSLAIVDGSGVRHVSAGQLGLNFLRGLACLGDSPFLAVSGEFHGLAIIDARSLEVVRRYDVPWCDNAHLSWQNSPS